MTAPSDSRPTEPSPVGGEPSGRFARWPASWPSRTQVVLLGFVAVASIAAVAGFRAVLADWSFMPAAVVAGLAAVTVVAAAWRKHLLVGESIAVSVVSFVVIGTIATSGIPTPDAFGTFFDGLAHGWADLLARTPPLDVTAEMKVLPFTLAWMGALIGGELVRHSNAPVLPTIGPLIALAVSVLITAEDRRVGVLQGAIIALTALLIGVVQNRRSASQSARGTDTAVDTDEIDDADNAPARRRRRALRAGVVLVIIAFCAPVVGPRLPYADAHERFDLRDRKVPPWDPLQIPSPLVQLKSSLKEEVSDDVVFTIVSEQPVDRVNLAVLGAFDGVVWTVGSNDSAEPSTEFRPVSSRLPDPPVELDIESSERRTTIMIDGLTGPWLPSVGWPKQIEFDDPNTTDDVRMNLVTGTLALPDGVTEGLTYDLVVSVSERPSDGELADRQIAELPETVDDNVVIPASIRNLAADVLEGADPGWEQLIALQKAFVDDGFYDTSSEARPGHSYFRLAEFLDDPDRLVGYEEQYAASAATISKLARLPTRVVVGYLIPPDRYDDAGSAQVTASDISAWIEIDFGAYGWVPLDVTPERSNEPVAQSTGITIEDVAVPSPPPPPQIPPDPEVFSGEEEPEENEDDEDDEDEDDDDPMASVGLGTGQFIAATSIGVFTLALAFFVLVAWWKVARRRRRRRSSDPALSVGWAWRETLDRYREVGFAPAPDATPRETMRRALADDIVPADAGADLDAMVGLVERSAYHREAPTDAIGEQAWVYYDEMNRAVERHHGRVDRIKMRADPRPVLSRQWKRRGWPTATPAPPRETTQ